MATNKESEHKQLVIANVEFCMLQFYRSQSEAAKRRLDAKTIELEEEKREHKRTRLSFHHQLAVTRFTQNELLDARSRIEALNGVVENMSDMIDNKDKELIKEKRQHDASMHSNLRFMDLISRMIAMHPELDEEWDFSEEAANIAQERLDAIHEIDEETDTEPEDEEQ